jgi:hypothetical protein
MVHAFMQAMTRGSGKLVSIGTGLESSENHPYRLPRSPRAASLPLIPSTHPGLEYLGLEFQRSYASNT